MSHIMVDGSIFNSFKEWLGTRTGWLQRKALAIMSCYQCSGFWSGGITGFLMSLAGRDPLGVETGWQTIPLAFCYACAGAYISMKAAVVIMWMQGPE